MEVKVYGQDGRETGRTVTLDDAVFGVEPSEHAVWLDVRSIQANARQGTHKAKEKSEAAGSTRKLYRQKGTGHARAGSAKSPIRRSGGTIFGPRPRTYTVALNRKTKQLARRSALTFKAREDALRVIEGFGLDAPSTKTLATLLKTLDLGGQKVLVVTDTHQTPVYLSGRNMPKVKVREAASVSTLDVLDAGVVILQEGALDVFSALLGNAPAAPSAEAAETA